MDKFNLKELHKFSIEQMVKVVRKNKFSQFIEIIVDGKRTTQSSVSNVLLVDFNHSLLSFSAEFREEFWKKNKYPQDLLGIFQNDNPLLAIENLHCLYQEQCHVLRSDLHQKAISASLCHFMKNPHLYLTQLMEFRKEEPAWNTFKRNLLIIFSNYENFPPNLFKPYYDIMEAIEQKKIMMKMPLTNIKSAQNKL